VWAYVADLRCIGSGQKRHRGEIEVRCVGEESVPPSRSICGEDRGGNTRGYQS
jgi:hypothetical protein